jgi:hypothetical protein
MNNNKLTTKLDKKLSDKNSNVYQLVVLSPDPRAQAKLKADISRHWQSFIQKDLRLSRTQKKHLKEIPAGESKKIEEALTQLLAQGGTLTLRYLPESSAGDSSRSRKGELIITGPSSRKAQRFTFIFFHCTFDANFQNWECGWGPARHRKTA